MARRQPNAKLIPVTGRYWNPRSLTLAQLKAFREWLNRVIKFREQQERAVFKKKRKTKKRSKPGPKRAVSYEEPFSDHGEAPYYDTDPSDYDDSFDDDEYDYW